MNYHNITKDDMLNGSGLRVCLWLSGCNHHCKGCQNPETWSLKSGIDFNMEAEEELFEILGQDYISGITFTGGDPFHEANLSEVNRLVTKVRTNYGKKKNIWIYTGYRYEDVLDDHDKIEILKKIDVLVDDKFVMKLADVSYPYAGSINQRVIDVPKSLEKGDVVLWKL